MFSELSYLQQIAVHRKIASSALSNYSLSSAEIQFVQHGENTTFRVSHPKRGEFLLRVHRANYHTDRSIGLELKWLEKLGNQGILVPRPLRNRAGSYLTVVKADRLIRQCDLLSWMPGRMYWDGLKPVHLARTGQLTATLHKCQISSKARMYWSPEGMCGTVNTWGDYNEVKRILPQEFPDINACRKKVLARIKRYQQSFPERFGLIHADLHFGNLLFHQGKVIPIDFDDCGYGAYLYDLAVTSEALRWIAKSRSKKEAAALSSALIEGYSSVRSLDSVDLEMLPVFQRGRKLLTLCWLISRSDNPGIKKALKKQIRWRMKELRAPL